MILSYDFSRNIRDSKEHEEAELHSAMGKKPGDSCDSALVPKQWALQAEKQITIRLCRRFLDR